MGVCKNIDDLLIRPNTPQKHILNWFRFKKLISFECVYDFGSDGELRHMKVRNLSCFNLIRVPSPRLGSYLVLAHPSLPRSWLILSCSWLEGWGG